MMLWRAITRECNEMPQEVSYMWIAKQNAEASTAEADLAAQETNSVVNSSKWTEQKRSQLKFLKTNSSKMPWRVIAKALNKTPE